MGTSVKLELVANGAALDISDIQNFVWAGHAGFGLAPLHRLLIRGPQQHGDSDIGYLLDPRMIQLTVRLMGTGIEDLYDKQSQLLGMLVPSTSPISLRFTRLDSGIVRQIDCNVAGGLDFPSTAREGFTLLEQISLRANDPTWYNPASRGVGYFAGSGTAGLSIPLAVPIISPLTGVINSTQSFAYPGTADSYPFLYITGPVADPVITFTSVEGSRKLDFTGHTISAGNWYFIDTRYPYKTVVNSAGTNKTGELTTDSNLATLKINKVLPGETSHTTSVTMTGTGGTVATRIDIYWFDRYIGL